MVALIEIFDQGPCGTFQIMKDHYNDIEHYTPLTVHAVYINSNSDLSKNNIPCCTFQVMNDHYNGIKHYMSVYVSGRTPNLSRALLPLYLRAAASLAK